MVQSRFLLQIKKGRFMCNSKSYSGSLRLRLFCLAPLLYSVLITNEAALPVSQTLYDIVSEGNSFVAVGANGTIFSSIKGGKWEARVSSVTNDLTTVGYGNGLFVAAGNNGLLLRSTNGVDWSVHRVGAVLSSPDIAFGNGRFVAGGKGANGFWAMLISTNGADWIVVNIEASAAPHLAAGMPFGGVSFGAGKFLAVGGMFAPLSGARAINLMLSSVDGITWREENFNGYSIAKGPITYGNGRFVIVVEAYYHNDDRNLYFDHLLISDNGAEWRSLEGQFPFQWRSNPGNKRAALVAADCSIVVTDPYAQTNSIWQTQGGLTSELRSPN
jgi:hypothetical protein